MGRRESEMAERVIGWGGGWWGGEEGVTLLLYWLCSMDYTCVVHKMASHADLLVGVSVSLSLEEKKQPYSKY